MQVCTKLQTDNRASTPPLSFLQADALPAAQPTASKHWRQKHSTEDSKDERVNECMLFNFNCWILFYFHCNYFFTLLRIYDTHIKIDTHSYWMDGKMFFGSQASGLKNSPCWAESDIIISVRSYLFILHRPLNTGMDWPVTKNYKLVKLQQECYESTIIPLWLHNRYNMTFTERRCVLK